MRTIDVISALSALGGLSSLSQGVMRYARAAMRWLRERRSRQLRLPLAVFLVVVTTQGTEGAAVYVIVDRRLSEEPLSVRLHTRAILSRSVSAGLTHMVRTSLELTAATARLQGIAFQYSAIPADYPSLNSFDFRAVRMRSLFQYGYQCAQAGRLWIGSQRGASEQHARAGAVDAEKIPCPSDDEFIGRFALR